MKFEFEPDDEAYDTFKKSLIAAYDALGAYRAHVLDFIEDSEDEVQRAALKAHVELVDKTRAELADWGLGLGTEP
jgi:hypothetical protein